MKPATILPFLISLLLLASCQQKKGNASYEAKNQPTQMNESTHKTAAEILSNPDYLAISYGGYRKNTREIQPTIEELKEDIKIMHSLGIRMLRTYNVRLPHASNVIKAIHEIKQEEDTFEMYLMLGAWIDCKNAWTDLPLNHNEESEHNEAEIARVVELANQYSDIVKVIAVGNEAMVKWATAYYVQPHIILKWVTYLQEIKKEGKLNADVWITSSDNFASWGGGETQYHTAELNKIIETVDFISMHTYPMHDTHYNPVFWGVLPKEKSLSNTDKLDRVMNRSLSYAISQYDSVVNYMKGLGVDKPVHIGETGWATSSHGMYGPNGSKATDEYKQALYYHKMREWTRENNIACFYFEAFDEPWKDAQNPKGSENFFGIFTVEGKAKYALWEEVDKGTFEGLKRGENSIEKTYNGNLGDLLLEVQMPPEKKEIIPNH